MIVFGETAPDGQSVVSVLFFIRWVEGFPFLDTMFQGESYFYMETGD